MTGTAHSHRLLIWSAQATIPYIHEHTSPFQEPERALYLYMQKPNINHGLEINPYSKDIDMSYCMWQV